MIKHRWHIAWCRGICLGIELSRSQEKGQEALFLFINLLLIRFVLEVYHEE